jgi:hypothetical protein
MTLLGFLTVEPVLEMKIWQLKYILKYEMSNVIVAMG